MLVLSMRPVFLDRKRQKLTHQQFLEKRCDKDYLVVGRTAFIIDNAQVEIVTIWDGVALLGDQRIFETRVFGGKFHSHVTRWVYEREAIERHLQTVLAVKNNTDPCDLIRTEPYALAWG